ncbi:DUF4870 domain-containing protein [bacterium]|nr:DUF4870 domain-containing protein [bacterium]
MEETPKKERNTGMAIVAYILFFIPLLTNAKNDPFVKYHVKQGLALFITAIAAAIINQFLFLIPFLGWGLSWLIGFFVFALFIVGVSNASKGEQKPLPLIGKFGEKFKF